MSRDYKLFLEDMREAISKIRRYTERCVLAREHLSAVCPRFRRPQLGRRPLTEGGRHPHTKTLG